MVLFFDKIEAKIAINTLSNTMDIGVWMQEPGSIIAFYLADEQKGINVMEVINAMSEDVILDGIKQDQEQIEREREREKQTNKCIMM